MQSSRKYNHDQIKLLRYSAQTKRSSRIHGQRGPEEPVGDNLHCSICKEQFYHAMYLNWHIRNEHMNEVVKVLGEQASKAKPVKLPSPKKNFVIRLPIATLPEPVSTTGQSWNTDTTLIKRAPRKLKPAIPNFGIRPDHDFEKSVASFSRPKKHVKKSCTTKSSKVRHDGSINSPSSKKTVSNHHIPMVASVPQKIKVKTETINSPSSKKTVSNHHIPMVASVPQKIKVKIETRKKLKSLQLPIAAVTDIDGQQHSHHPKQDGESIPSSITAENQAILCEPPSQVAVRAQVSPCSKPQTCFICYQQLESSWGLAQHVKISHKHELGPFECGNCALKFRDHSGFLVHYLRKCKDATELGCKYCPRDFNSLTCKELHESRHETSINDVHECEYCGFVYFRSALLAKHILLEHKG